MLQPIPEDTANTRPRGDNRRVDMLTEVGNLASLGQTLVYEPSTTFEGISLSSTVIKADVVALRPAATRALMRAESHAQEPSPKDRLDAELLSYRELPQGWDGYGGIAASSDAVADALSFLDTKPQSIPLPYPQIAPDGEVGLYWRTEGVYAEVGFFGNGEFSYYARYTPSDEQIGLLYNIPTEVGDDGCRLETDRWPEYLLLILNRLEQ